MYEDFQKKLVKGTLLYVIKKEPQKEFILELLERVRAPGCYCAVRYLTRHGLPCNLLGAMKGMCFLPCCRDVYDVYIIKEEY